MKKLIALLLSFILILSCLSMSASAVSQNAGMDALMSQFFMGDDVLDYVFYTPVKDKKDKTKYPLVVWLHGNSSGDYPGHQLENSDIALWSSEEYQSRFKNAGGAFLFLPRYPTNSISLAWEGSTTSLKNSIDAFVERYKNNIDTSRIYIGGYSMGGKMVLRMASTYPDFFAAAFPLSPVYAPSVPELNALVDMPIWFAWCQNDTYVSLNPVTVRSNWSYLMSISNCKEDCRLATFDKIYYFDYRLRDMDDGSDTHNTWDAATHDFFMIDNAHYKDVAITDGNGNDITLTFPDGLIGWLSSQSLDEDDVGARGSLISRLLSGIVDFFKNFIVALMGILTDNL